MNARIRAIVVACAATLSCAKSSAGAAGSGGSATATGSHSASTSSAATTAASTGDATGVTGASSTTVTSTSVTIASATTGTGPTMTCDSIGVCQLPGNTNPSKDCVTCAVIGSMSMFTNGGTCRPAFNTAFGNDGACTTSGFPAACNYLSCAKTCEGASGMFDTQKKWDCYCTNDQMGANSSCTTAQTNTSTCLGALEADMPAYQAEMSFEDCLYGTSGACVSSCLGGG